MLLLSGVIGVWALLHGVAAGSRVHSAHLLPRARSGRVCCWTGETVASLEMPDGIPISTLYSEYADLNRMTEWSPLLESVIVDKDEPNFSVWVMKVPRALQALASYLGYDPVVTWEADLHAPGPPRMQWTSSVRAGVQNAGFEPAGEVLFSEATPGGSVMTLTLRYTLAEPAARWKIALVVSPVVQGIMRSRMVAGMQRFAKAMRREYRSEASAGQTSAASIEGEGASEVRTGSERGSAESGW